MGVGEARSGSYGVELYLAGRPRRASASGLTDILDHSLDNIEPKKLKVFRRAYI